MVKSNKKTTAAVKAHIEAVKPVTVQDILAAQNIKEKQELVVNSLLNQVPHVNPFLYGTDSYKVSHIRFETNGVKEIYSNFTPRFAKYLQQLLGDAFDGNYVVFGVQWLLLRLHVMAKTGFFDRDKETVISEMRRVLTPYIGQDNFEHFEALHDLGYLPVEIKTLDEGTVAPVGVPFLTIRNTLPEFEWLPNYLETLISTDSWKQLTVATISAAFKRISEKAALETVGTTEGVGLEWQNHDFSCRGQSGFESSAINGAAFLTASCGTDNMASLWAAEKFYFSTNEEGLLAGSVSAGEHSVTTSGILTEQERAKAQEISESAGVPYAEIEREVLLEKIETQGISLTEAERRYARLVLTEKFPNGIVAYVADSFDFWTFVSTIVPSLKSEILARDGKFVVRGDSGNPVDVITGFEDVDLIDAVARKYVEQAVIGNTFTVNDVVYLAVRKPELPANKYLPLFELVRHGFVRNVTEEINNLNEKIDAVYKIANDNKTELTEEDRKYVNSLDNEILELSELEHTVIAAEEKGTIEVLWEIFGGSYSELGYKILDPRIGMIYGDGITVQRSQQIFARLKKRGFASTNIVYGVGSYSLNMISRDHLGMAIKATNTIVDILGVDVDKPIYKEPKTDSTKKSSRGLIRVYRDETGKIAFEDMQTREQENSGLLTVAYKDSAFEKFTTLFEIRDREWK